MRRSVGIMVVVLGSAIVLGVFPGSVSVARQGGGVCVDLDGDGYGSPGDLSCPMGAIDDCDDTNRVCGASCDFELCSGPAGLDTVLTVTDIDGDGIADLLVVLTDPLTAVTTLAIYDSTSGTILRSIGTSSAYLPAGVGLAPSLGGTPAPEVGVLGVRDDGLALLQLRDAGNGGVVSNVFFPAETEPRDIEVFGDYPGVPGAVVGLLGFNTSATRGQILLRRVDTGAVLGSIVFNPAYEPKALGVVPNFGGTTAPEFVMLGQTSTGLTLAQVRDSQSGLTLQNVFFSSIDVPLGMTIVEEIPGFGPAIGVFGHHKILDRIVLELREAATGDFVRTVVSHRDFPATQFAMLSSYAGTLAPEAVFAGELDTTGLVLAQSRDSSTGFRLDNVFFGSAYDVRSLTTRVTFDGVLRWEVILLGRDRLTGRPRVQVRDLMGGALIDTFFPAVCGDGVTDTGEECDDGNQTDGDGCSASCLADESVCGDGTTESGEECDDGNTTDGDGCSSTCVIDVSGNYQLTPVDTGFNACQLILEVPFPLSIDQIGDTVTLVQGNIGGPGSNCTESTGSVSAGELSASGGRVFVDHYDAGCDLIETDIWALEFDLAGNVTGVTWDVTLADDPPGCSPTGGFFPCTTAFTVTGSPGAAGPTCSTLAPAPVTGWPDLIGGR